VEDLKTSPPSIGSGQRLALLLAKEREQEKLWLLFSLQGKGVGGCGAFSFHVTSVRRGWTLHILF